MKKLLILILLLVPFNIYANDSNGEIKTISENSSDINSDKSKVQISESLSIETGFGNNTSNATELSQFMLKGLNIINFFIGIVAFMGISYLVASMIFINNDQQKAKTKQLLIYVVSGFIFYGFLAGGIYVWIIEQGKKSSSPYYNEVIDKTLKDGTVNDLNPKLLRPE